MALPEDLTVNTLPDLSPVYSNNLILNASYNTADSDFTYKFEVYIDGVVYDTFRYPANPLTYDATIDLSPILSTWWKSEVYTPTGSTVCEIMPNQVIQYKTKVTVYDETNTEILSVIGDTYNMFNGCANINEGFDMSNYIMSSGNSGNFLTHWVTDRTITIDDIAYLNVITGSYDDDSDFGGVTIKTYGHDSVLITAVTENYTATTNDIVNIDVSPSKLNTIWTGLIDEDVMYYTVEEYNGYNDEPMKICLDTPKKTEKYFNFNYINRLGGHDFFTATLIDNTEYDIEKELLEHYVNQKPYYTKVDETLSVETQFLSVSQAKGLASLFQSPAVKVWSEGRLSFARIVNKKVITRGKYPKDVFIQYVIEFKFNNKYFTQQF